MIKGDINKVIEWLQANCIQQWTVTHGNSTNGQGKIFESNIEMSMETEIERFRQIMALSENAIVKIIGKVNPKQQTGVFIETWSNVSAPIPVNNAIGGVTMDADYIDKKIAAAVAEERMAWREKELAKREQSLAEAEKEYKRNSEGIMGILIDKAAPFLANLLPSSAVAGVQSQTPVQAIPVKEYEQDSQAPTQKNEEIFTDEESERLFNAVAKFKEADADYLQIIESIVDFACSGEPINVMGVKLSYDTVKGFLINK